MINGRILGIDFGTKRIGFAISDENRTLAFPKEVVSNDSNILKKIGEIIQAEEITEIVVGESLDSKGRENTIQKKIKFFIEKLESLYEIKVHLEKEFMSSVEARRTQIFKSSLNQTQASSRVKKEKDGRADAKAAAIILQRYLDRKR